MQKILTITIPSYNVEAYIAATLDTMVTINNLDSVSYTHLTL